MAITWAIMQTCLLHHDFICENPRS